MSFKLLASIRNFGLHGQGDYPTPIFTLTETLETKQQLIDLPFKKTAGVRANQSYNKNTIAYYIDENAKESVDYMSIIGAEVAHRGAQIETFLLFLWFVKDNSVSLEQVYGLFTEAEMFNWWTGNNIFSTSDGQFNKIDFSKEEIDNAANLLLTYISKCVEDSDMPNAPELPRVSGTEPPEFISSVDPYKEENRFERALAFLKTARAVPHVPQKIAHYMAILECLFSNNNTKIIDNVSKRTAAYLEDVTVRGIIKKAYDMRSRFVHGEKMKWTPERMCTKSKQADDIIRRVLKKIILEDYETFLQENMTAYFMQLINKFHSLPQ